MAINETHIIKAISELEFNVKMQNESIITKGESQYVRGYLNCLTDIKDRLGL